MALFLESLYHFFLLLRCYTSKNAVFRNSFLKLFFCFQCCRIYVVLGILEPCTFRDCGNCDRIITRDHLEVNLLAVKEL